MDPSFVRRHITAVAIVLFIAVYAALAYTKPACMYNGDGSLRQFGVGRSRKTILPLWLAGILVASIIYLALLYFIATPKT